MGSRMDKLDERMFWIVTGKNREDAILEERIKREERIKNMKRVKHPKTDP